MFSKISPRDSVATNDKNPLKLGIALSLSLTCFIMASFFISGSLFSIEYEVTKILPPGWTNSHAHDLNDYGHVLLSRRTKSGSWETFIWYGPGNLTQIASGENSVSAWRMNNRNETIVTIDPDPLDLLKPSKPFYWSPDSGLIPLTLPEGLVNLEDGKLVPGSITDEGKILLKWVVVKKNPYMDILVYDFSRKDEWKTFVFSPSIHSAPESYGTINFHVEELPYDAEVNQDGTILVETDKGHEIRTKAGVEILPSSVENGWFRESAFLTDSNEVVGLCSLHVGSEFQPSKHAFYSWSLENGIKINEIQNRLMHYYVGAIGINRKGLFLLQDKENKPSPRWKTWLHKQGIRKNIFPNFMRGLIDLQSDKGLYVAEGKQIVDLLPFFFSQDSGWTFRHSTCGLKKINERNQILGEAEYHGNICAFLLSPLDD